jgi:hypothetical protein
MGFRPLEAAFHLRPVQYDRPHRLVASGGLGIEMRTAAIEFLLQVKQCAKITHEVTGPEGRSRRPESLWPLSRAKSKVRLRMNIFSALGLG